MRKILVTGVNSYIGMSFENYLKNNFPGEYEVGTIDMTDSMWHEKSFSGYDSVFHVAGIVHQKESNKNAEDYYKVNHNLTLKVAQKAKENAVRQFIFLSTMSVYGMDQGVITKHTEPHPKSHYGKSKLLAEQDLLSLNDEKFKVAILRPPMVYGKHCKGNFNSVLKIVKYSSVFPRVSNARSMIYIDNLSSFVELVIRENLSGIYMPQNDAYTQTSEMAKIISKHLGKRLFLSGFLGVCVRMTMPVLKISQKAFGSLIYRDCEDFDFSYCTVDFETSIKNSI